MRFLHTFVVARDNAEMVSLCVISHRPESCASAGSGEGGCSGWLSIISLIFGLSALGTSLRFSTSTGESDAGSDGLNKANAAN